MACPLPDRCARQIHLPEEAAQLREQRSVRLCEKEGRKRRGRGEAATFFYTPRKRLPVRARALPDTAVTFS